MSDLFNSHTKVYEKPK